MLTTDHCNVAQSEFHMADGASVPALGLSNKAVYLDELKANDLVISEKKDKDQYSKLYFIHFIFICF